MGKSPDALPAVFLDRDGVLIQDCGYGFQPAQMQLMPGAGKALAALKARGFLLIVVTNQSGVARGYFNLFDVWACHRKIQSDLQNEVNLGIDAFYICPHHPQGSVPTYTVACKCRKPAPGLIEAACAEFPINLEKSFMIGDKPSDIDCGIAAGVSSVQVSSTEHERHPKAKFHVKNLAEAVKVIL